MIQIKLKNLTFGTYRLKFKFIPNTKFASTKFSALKFSQYLEKHIWEKYSRMDKVKLCKTAFKKFSLKVDRDGDSSKNQVLQLRCTARSFL